MTDSNMQGKWYMDFCRDWETICLNALGQEKYNMTRNLCEDYKGIFEKPYIPVGKKTL